MVTLPRLLINRPNLVTLPRRQFAEMSVGRFRQNHLFVPTFEPSVYFTLQKVQLRYNKISVTRFGEISPKCTMIKNFAHFETVHLIFVHTFWLAWANSMYFWAHFQCCKWPNIKQIIQQSCHTGTSEKNLKKPPRSTKTTDAEK